MSESPITDAVQFRNEMLWRLFNPQSYFFFCFSTRLSQSSLFSQRVDDPHYTLIGAILEKLINSEDKLSEIRKLSNVTGMRGFCQHLETTVGALTETLDDSDQLKRSIGILAYDMADTMVNLCKDPNAIDEFNNYLYN